MQFAQRPGITSGPTTALHLFVLQLVLHLFDIFGGDIDSGIHSPSAHLLSTKLSDVADALERRNIIWKAFDRLETSVRENIMKFVKVKCKGAALGLG